MIETRFAKSIAESFGTPVYAYDLTELEERTTELRSVIPTDARLLYSMKANPLPSICSTLRELGCEAEISSEGELGVALQAGFDPSRVLFTGPGKTERELRAAIGAGVGTFSVESSTDLDRIAAVLQTMGTQGTVLLRVNPEVTPRPQLSMTGTHRHFGLRQGELLRGAHPLSRQGSRARVAGLHIYQGTQYENRDALINSFTVAVQAAESVQASFHFPCEILDVGGGFGWPFGLHGNNDIVSLREPLHSVLGNRELTAGARVWFESGRFLTASCGTLIAQVLDVKDSLEGRRTVVIDAGINNLSGMSGLGRLLRPKLSIASVRGSHDEVAVGEIDLVGPLCTPLDVLALKVATPPLTPGDLVMIPNVGAYGLTASLVSFLGRTPPAEVTYRGETVTSVYRLNAGHRKIE